MRDSKINGPQNRLTPAAEQRAPIEERPVSQILQDILTNVQEIVRGEVRLVKTEISEEINKATRAAVLMVIGGVLGIYALGFILWSGAYALREVTPAWLAPLLIGIVLAIAAGIFLVVARNRFRVVNTVPQKTIASVKEDVQWVKDQTK